PRFTVCVSACVLGRKTCTSRAVRAAGLEPEAPAPVSSEACRMPPREDAVRCGDGVADATATACGAGLTLGVVVSGRAVGAAATNSVVFDPAFDCFLPIPLTARNWSSGMPNLLAMVVYDSPFLLR